MLVTKKKHNLLIKNYNELVENRDTWQSRCIHHANNLDRAYEEVNELREYIKERNSEIKRLKNKLQSRDEMYQKVCKKYIENDVELQIVDRIVLQYEQRINELEEQLNDSI